MNPICRRGQKVVCVIEVEYESAKTGQLYAGPEPKLDGVYTVRDFIDSSKTVCLVSWPPCDEVDPACAIELFEIPSPLCGGRPIGWPIVCFRPVDERETDIGIFTKAPTRQLEDA